MTQSAFNGAPYRARPGGGVFAEGGENLGGLDKFPLNARGAAEAAAELSLSGIGRRAKRREEQARARCAAQQCRAHKQMIATGIAWEMEGEKLRYLT